MKHVLLILCLFITACSPYVHRGDFSLISTKNLDNEYEILYETKVMGRACFDPIKSGLFIGDAVFKAATKDALSKAKGAKILVDAEFLDNGACVDVTGYPAK